MFKQTLFFIILLAVAIAAGLGIYYWQQNQDLDLSGKIKVKGVTYNETACNTYDQTNCPEQCRVCAACPTCADLYCHSQDFCAQLESKPDLEL